jgi:hypothetical protein
MGASPPYEPPVRRPGPGYQTFGLAMIGNYLCVAIQRHGIVRGSVLPPCYSVVFFLNFASYRGNSGKFKAIKEKICVHPRNPRFRVTIFLV